MNNIIFAEQRKAQSKVMRVSIEDGYTLNVAMVFQDAATEAWTEDVRDLMVERVGEGAVQSTEWNINSLPDPSTFTRGIQALAKADAIVIALHEADRLPGEFYLWVNLWLQVRSGKPGALIALVGKSGEEGSEWIETRRYLHAVASQGGLELFVKECSPADSLTDFEPDDLRPLARAA